MPTYQEIRKLIPREFQSTLSGVRGYAESALNFYQFKTKLSQQQNLTHVQKRQRLAAEIAKIDTLTTVLFTYALYLLFTRGDEAIKTAVAVFGSLGVEKVNIGSMELSKLSKYYDMGRTLASKLYECINDQELRNMFSTKVQFHSIVEWYRKES